MRISVFIKARYEKEYEKFVERMQSKHRSVSERICELISQDNKRVEREARGKDD
jgi:hypothetical protein